MAFSMASARFPSSRELLNWLRCLRLQARSVIRVTELNSAGGTFLAACTSSERWDTSNCCAPLSRPIAALAAKAPEPIAKKTAQRTRAFEELMTADCMAKEPRTQTDNSANNQSLSHVSLSR